MRKAQTLRNWRIGEAWTEMETHLLLLMTGGLVMYAVRKDCVDSKTNVFLVTCHGGLSLAHFDGTVGRAG